MIRRTLFFAALFILLGSALKNLQAKKFSLEIGPAINYLQVFPVHIGTNIRNSARGFDIGVRVNIKLPIKLTVAAEVLYRSQRINYFGNAARSFGYSIGTVPITDLTVEYKELALSVSARYYFRGHENPGLVGYFAFLPSFGLGGYRLLKNRTFETQLSVKIDSSEIINRLGVMMGVGFNFPISDSVFIEPSVGFYFVLNPPKGTREMGFRLEMPLSFKLF